MSDTESVQGGDATSTPELGPVFEDFIAAVHQLENALTGTRVIFADGDLSIGDWVVLRNIPPDEEIRVGLLARRTGLSRQRLNKLLEGLSETRLVEDRLESTDKRIRLVRISQAGKRTLAGISRQMHGLADKTVGNTKPETLQRFATVARRIVSTMTARPADAPAEKDALGS
jgi:DNA-binding MarR family transcriptional regulator